MVVKFIVSLVPKWASLPHMYNEKEYMADLSYELMRRSSPGGGHLLVSSSPRGTIRKGSGWLGSLAAG